QYWRIDKINDIITLTNLRSGKTLSHNGNSEWRIERHEGGYSLTNTASGGALDVFNHSVNPGDKVGTYEFGGGENQLWNFVRGNLESSVDVLVPNGSDEKLVPTSVEGTAPYGGNDEVSFEKAFDGDVRTHHDAWDGDNSYLAANMPQDKPVTLIRFYPRSGFEGRMYGGKFYGVKDGKETLLYTVPNQLKNNWNEVYIKNEVVYDQIIYRTPRGGLCNVAEIEFYNIPFTVQADYDDGLSLKIESFKEASRLALTIVYRDKGVIRRVDMTDIYLEEYAFQDIKKELCSDFESAEFYLTENGTVISGGYIYLADI
ncbi:MAG: RICIN domain-containing protein, partial [Clostridia bacterium]